MAIPAAPVTYDFRGHRAIVTGAARGIGRAIADALAAAGATVHGFDVGAPEDFPYGRAAVDITDSAAVLEALAALPAPPTLLVNNAGITRDRTIANMTDEEWATVIRVNLTGAFQMIRAVAPLMSVAGFGRIVSITSINGLRGKFGQGNYAASKAGLIGLTKSAAKELGRKGITVNAVAPGMVMTRMARDLDSQVTAQARAEAVLAALAGADDVAHAVLFLLSDAARAITGEVLRVDAGQYI
jgi:3-oxoacyl-[acyl-carrier protein] reductase